MVHLYFEDDLDSLVENTDHYYRFYNSRSNTYCRVFEILSRTPQGVWLKLDFGDKQLVMIGAKKSFAYPTLALAAASYAIRKEKQIVHIHRQLDYVQDALITAKKLRGLYASKV